MTTRGTSDPLRRLVAPVWRALRSRDERRDLVWEIRRRLGGEPRLPTGPVERVLVVCYGNICRSPFAERWLARSCPAIEVRSAGFEAGPGVPAEPEAIRVAAEFGVDLTDHAARRMSAEDVAWADLIVGMTGRHVGLVADRWPEGAARVRLLGDYLEVAPYGLEDPWGCPPEAFRAVYSRIVRAGSRLATRLDETRRGSARGPGSPAKPT